MEKSDLPTDDPSTTIIYYYYEDNLITSFSFKRAYDFPQIRLSIFLIFSVCVGLPVQFLAVYLLDFNRKIRGRISAFIILLLINNLSQLFLNIYAQSRILTSYRSWDPELLRFWSSLTLSGFLLHQLVALEGVLTLKYPLFSARIFSLPCYIIICILVLVFSISVVLFYLLSPVFNEFLLSFSLGTTLVPLCLLAVTCTFTCKAPAIRNTHLVFAVAMVTFVMLYFPFMLVSFVDFFIMDVQMSWFDMSVCLMSLRVISDPILCVLICRENLRDVQTPETHTEPNADQMTG